MKRNTADIAGRMANFYERQIVILEEMKGELPALQEVLNRDAEAAAVEFHKRREHALAILAKEFELLKREWTATDGLSADERAQVEELSQRAQALIADVQPALAASVALAQEKMSTMESSMTELRRGKQVMRAYKTREQGQGSGLDRQG